MIETSVITYPHITAQRTEQSSQTQTHTERGVGRYL